MTTINAHFDGKVIVPDEPVDLPKGKRLRIHLDSTSCQNKPTPAGTAKDLLQSGLIGIWADRTDIDDSLEYARELRRRAERRMG